MTKHTCGIVGLHQNKNNTDCPSCLQSLLKIRDERIEQLKQHIEELEEKLREASNILHHGGLLGKTDCDARKLLISHWDRNECARLQVGAIKGEG